MPTTPPWMKRNSEGNTPLHCCLIRTPDKTKQMEVAARYLAALDSLTLLQLNNKGDSPLFCAMMEGYSELVAKILSLESSKYSVAGGSHRKNPLHYASRCNEEVSRLLLENHKELIGEVSEENGDTVLHSAVRDNAAWLVKLMLTEGMWNKACRRLIWQKNTSGHYPLHIAAEIGNVEIAELLIEGYVSALQEEAVVEYVAEDTPDSDDMGLPPWEIRNSESEIPLFVALKNKHDGFAVYLLSLQAINGSPYYRDGGYERVKIALPIALLNGCVKATEKLLERSKYHGEYAWLNFDENLGRMDRIVQKTICYILMQTPEEAIELSNKVISILTKPSMDAKTHLAEAVERRQDWLVELFLKSMKNDKLFIEESVQAWKIACDKGYLSTLLTFIEHCNHQEFITHCRDNKDTPLHHIQGLQYEEYKELLREPVLVELHNQIDSDNATPLHRAIEGNNHSLAKALLEIEGIQLMIRDNKDKTALDLIEERCKSDQLWYELYKVVLARPNMLQKLKNRQSRGEVTPLSLAIVYNNTALVKNLLKSEDIRIDVKYSNNKTAWDLLEERPKLYKLLFKDSDIGEKFKNHINGRRSPLHLAIEWNDLDLAKTLLETEGINLSIIDGMGRSVLNVLEKCCEDSELWDKMCRGIKQESTIKQLKQVLRRVAMGSMQQSASMVAALVATISFAAGFTIPGGDEKDGTAVLATEAAFLAFFICNTLAMCCSIVVLFLLLGPMIWDTRPAHSYVNLSLWLLQISLLSTIVAFMTGIYAVMAPKVLWAAIVVIVLCGVASVAALWIAFSTYWLSLSKLFKKYVFSACCSSDKGDQSNNVLVVSTAP